MTQDTVTDVIQMALMAIITASAPPLIMGLVVGILVSIFQAVTSIQEPTLAFIPKILAVLGAILVFGPFIQTTISEVFIQLYSNIPQYVIPR